jgi:hypothetical protein
MISYYLHLLIKFLHVFYEDQGKSNGGGKLQVVRDKTCRISHVSLRVTGSCTGFS